MVYSFQASCAPAGVSSKTFASTQMGEPVTREVERIARQGGWRTRRRTRPDRELPPDQVTAELGSAEARFARQARRESPPRRRAKGQAGIMTTITDLDDFRAPDPFFRVIEKGLDGLADGGHFFDLLAEDVIFDYVITVPGYPRHVVGRSAVAELYRPYGDTFVLHRCFDLGVHHDRESGVVVLEYAS
jgi:hypothetical protein